MNIAAILGIAFSLAPPADAKTVWETFKGMEGEWQGVANDGRKIRHTMELIAGGTVVMEKSWFDAHPGQLMVTMYHLDNDKLMLTHYCVARNQPRLDATEISPEGKTVLFTYRDATNVVSRDKTGHMDKAQYTFIDKDTFRSKWTFYKEGKEQWMEEFTFHRVKGKETVALSSVSSAPCCPKG